MSLTLKAQSSGASICLRYEHIGACKNRGQGTLPSVKNLGRIAKIYGDRDNPVNGSFSCFVNLLKFEEAGKQIILIVDGPAARKAESLPQPQLALKPAIVLRAVLNDWSPSISMPCRRCLVT
jgi:hypothetical protein